ncbi:MAG: aldo/keto reductase [Clostridiaceae bacterium]|nr:aldo/keto reductase [Clostridiaceae bacterium]
MHNIELNNGVMIPGIGFGTYKTGYSTIKLAIECGYRYFDTASKYENEEDVGLAIKNSGVPRNEFFVATKAWRDEMGYHESKKAFNRSLERLQMDYVDLYIIHWPKPTSDYKGWEELVMETWKAFEEIYKEKKARAIGLSNFLPHHLDIILENCEVKPMTNQLEVHPGYSQDYALSYCKDNSILVQAWSPLGRERVLNHPLILELANKYGATSAQVCIRYAVQRGIVPIPKASSMERMKSNLDVFSFEIDKQDMHRLITLPQTGWSGEHPDFERVPV